MFNYGKFQAKVDIKVLANDIALKIVQAQKDAMSGKVNSNAITNWKPSYGVYFNNVVKKTDFDYFADLSNTEIYSYNPTSCLATYGCLEKIYVTKGNNISSIDTYLGSTHTSITGSLAIIFTRPSSEAVFFDSTSGTKLTTGFDYIQITITSPQGPFAYIDVYPSGRVQIK